MEKCINKRFTAKWPFSLSCQYVSFGNLNHLADITISSLNVTGLQSAAKRRDILNFVYGKQSLIIFLQETQLS